MRISLRFLLLLALTLSSVRAGISIDSAHVNEIAAWLPPKATGLGRPVTDRAAWEKLAKLAAFSSVISRAESLAKEPVPDLTDELFLDYSKTGNRDRCQRVLFARSARVDTLALAECLENQGRFIAPLTETLAAICREKTWVYPAHDGRLDNFYGRTVEMDLRATAVAWELASVDSLLASKLSAATRQLLKENIQRRVLQPFRDMAEGRRKEISWMRAQHNWNAVCLAGVCGAALALEDSPKDRAWFIAATEDYIRYFLKGFGPDGYCVEGVGYWNYGFGHFLMLGETIRQATGGHIDLLADPAALQPSLYCTRAEVLNGIFPTIADCHPGSRPDSQFVCFIRQRFGISPDHCAAEFVKPTGMLPGTLLFSFLNLPLPPVPHETLPPDSPLRTWFKDAGVLISRTAPGSLHPFATAIKPGANTGNHHHDDTGSFSVVVGNSMVICDPGGEVYTARTFSAHRLDSKVINSYGHAVPVVAGRLQRDGAEARAKVERAEFTPDTDTLAVDLTSAYAVPELKSLKRTFSYHRGDHPGLTVRDAVTFNDPKTFETALITWADWKKLSDTELLLTDTHGAVRVTIDSAGEPVRIAAEEINEDVTTPRKPTRIGIALARPIQAATITLSITPAD